MRLNKLLSALFAITITGSSLLMVGCDADTSADAAKTVDTREVTKPAEPSVPSLEKRVESELPPAFSASPDSVAMPSTSSRAQPPMMDEVVPENKAEVIMEATETTEAVTQLATAPVADGQQLYSTCMGCHGMTGGGGVGPKLQGQSRDDIITKMTKYRAGEQVGPMTAMMAPMAANLKDAEIEALADYIVTF
jgi:cytochrome c553